MQGPPLPVGRALETKGAQIRAIWQKQRFIRFWGRSRAEFDFRDIYIIRRVIFMIRWWNFHSIGISGLKMALRENFNANFNNGRRILATSSGIGIELLPIRLISSGTSFFQARRPSRGLPRYLLPCPWGSRARHICYSICKGLNI